MAIKVGSQWVHLASGAEYEVIVLANGTADLDRMSEYPLTVVYKRLHDGTIWSRPIDRWHGGFERVPQYQVDGMKVRHIVLSGKTIKGYLVEVPGGCDYVEANEVNEVIEL